MNGELAGPTPATRFETIEALQAAIRAVPGVAAASAGVFTPLSGAIAAAPLEVPGTHSPRAADGRATTIFNPVLPGFFDAVGTPLIAGRGFDDGDGPGTPAVAIVNEAFRAEHFGDGGAIGRVITRDGVEMHIVGVVADARVVSLKEQKTAPTAFGLLTQLGTTGPIGRLRFVVRSVDPEIVRGGVAEAVARVDPRLGIEMTTMRDDAARSVERERLIAWLGGAFAALGLALAVIGLSGTFAYLAARRRTEIGVRMVVGATSGDVLWLVAHDAARLTGLGVAVGLCVSWGAARVVQGLLVGVDARDPRLLGAAVAAVALAAAVATIGPARRASRTDPAAALRGGAFRAW